MSDNTMREAFLRLRTEFLEICGGRIGVLREQMQILHGDGPASGKTEALELMRREAHTVAGSSGTYGYPEVSECARTLEAVCVRFMADSGDQVSGEADIEAVAVALDSLLAETDLMFANPEKGIVPF